MVEHKQEIIVHPFCKTVSSFAPHQLYSPSTTAPKTVANSGPAQLLRCSQLPLLSAAIDELYADMRPLSETVHH